MMREEQMDSYGVKKQLLRQTFPVKPGDGDDRKKWLEKALTAQSLDDRKLKDLAVKILLGADTFTGALKKACAPASADLLDDTALGIDTWPFGKKAGKTFCSYLAVCPQGGSFSEMMDDVMSQIRAASGIYPGYDDDCSILILTAEWDSDVVKEYEEELIQRCVNADILPSVFMVTEYGVAELPVFGMTRKRIRAIHEDFGDIRYLDREKATGELEWYFTTYTVAGKKGGKDVEEHYQFDFFHRTWKLYTESEDAPEKTGRLTEAAVDDFYGVALNYYDYEAEEEDADKSVSALPRAEMYDMTFDLTKKSLAPLAEAFRLLVGELA